MNAAGSGEVDARAWAQALGISVEAVELYLASEVIDLHIDSFIWTRMFGYDVRRRHGRGLFNGRFYSQVDLPRLRQAHVGGAMWSITTNPFRSAGGRASTFAANLAELRGIFDSVPEQACVVRDHAEYGAARARGQHAVLLAIQGGNALDRDLAALDELGDAVLRVTLLHLTKSRLGRSSTPQPSAAEAGLSEQGRAYVAELNARRVFVDLAHIGRRSFFDAVEQHDSSQPLLVTHTGVKAVWPSWRNIDDEQLRAVAATGGVVGVIYNGGYLSGHYLSGGRAADIARHLEHIVTCVGPDVPALGSDWDGFIIPPADMRTCLELPRLVQALLDRKFDIDVIQNILGRNFLRAFSRLRPGRSARDRANLQLESPTQK
ncbi:MAG TPA: membrane dipeptidase [Polyangiales bacterium]|nr:membrane dipeptidase [Polyangiales bacterium]